MSNNQINYKLASKGVIAATLLVVSSISMADCKLSKKCENGGFTTDLKSNQICIDELKKYEQCLSADYKKISDATYIKKYREQQAEIAALNDKIAALYGKRSVALSPLENHDKYGIPGPGSPFNSKEQQAAREQYFKKLEKEKAAAAKRLGLTDDK